MCMTYGAEDADRRQLGYLAHSEMPEIERALSARGIRLAWWRVDHEPPVLKIKLERDVGRHVVDIGIALGTSILLAASPKSCLMDAVDAAAEKLGAET